MNTRKLSFFLVLVLAIARGQSPRPANTAESPHTHIQYAEELRVKHRSIKPHFVLQAELDGLIHEGGGGACASAAANSAFQLLRLMNQFDPVDNPHQLALRAFAESPALLKGRVTNEQFEALLKWYGKELHGMTLVVDIESSPTSTYNIRRESTWPRAIGPDLDLRPNELKIVSYTVTDSDGAVIGRHFVILLARAGDELTVLDPNDLLKNRIYKVALVERDGSKEQAFLESRFIPKGWKYEVNTIFRLTPFLKKTTHEVESTITPRSVEHVNSEFDKLAKSLRGTEEFLSPRTWRERSHRFGLPGLDLPLEVGGSQWPAAKMVEVFRNAGRHNLNFRDVVGGAHGRALLKANSQKAKDVVSQVAKGKAYVAIAITEPTAGSNIPGIKSTAVKVPGGFKLTGEKRFNARLEQATHAIIFTQGANSPAGKLSAFFVPIDHPGLNIEKLQAHGLLGNSYGGLKFNDMFVSDDSLIGNNGEGLDVFFEHFLYWRLMQTAAAIGTAEDALKQMAERIKSREAFGGPIGRFTHLQQPIGQYTAQLQMAFTQTKEAARLLDAGMVKDRKVRAMICGLKAEGVEIALQAVDAAMRAFGGEGYSTNVDLGDRYKDLLGLRIADGTTDVMRMEVVRQTYGKEFWEMAVSGENKSLPSSKVSERE
jgi:alkylation response protein AidB-like acyl-CoA dehydrogenase